MLKNTLCGSVGGDSMDFYRECLVKRRLVIVKSQKHQFQRFSLWSIFFAEIELIYPTWNITGILNAQALWNKGLRVAWHE